MKQLGYMQAWYGNTGNGCEFLYSYHSKVVVSDHTGITFGRDAFYSTSTGRQISRYFREVFGEIFPELETAAGRRAAIKRGYTEDCTGGVVAVRIDRTMH